MLGPSGERTGQMRPYWLVLMSRMEKEARSLVTPPGPITERRRRLSISDRGLVWSRIVDKRLRRKNSEIVAIMGRALTKVEGVINSSVLVKLIFSRIDRSRRSKPTLKAVSITNSPTQRTLRLAR